MPVFIRFQSVWSYMPLVIKTDYGTLQYIKNPAQPGGILLVC